MRVGLMFHLLRTPLNEEHGTTDHRTRAEHQQNTETIAECWNTGGKTKHWRNNRNTTEHMRRAAE